MPEKLETNPLALLEQIIAFDPRDWSVNYRDFLIYAIVFGWDKEIYRERGYSDERIKELEKLHARYLELRDKT